MVTCVIPSRPHQAAAGLLICHSHLDQLGEELIGIEEEMDRLETFPSMQIVWGGKGGKLAREQVPVRIDAVAHTDPRLVRTEDVNRPYGFDLGGPLSAYGVLHYWANKVRDGRMLGRVTYTVIDRIPGSGIGPICNDCDHISCLWMRWRQTVPAQLTIGTERRLLTRHLEWCAAEIWIDEMSGQIHQLYEQLQHVNGTADPGPIPGRCPRLVDDGGGECGGNLWPVKPKHTSGALVHVGNEEVVQAIECERNANHHWEDKDLIRLAIILDQQAAEAS